MYRIPICQIRPEPNLAEFGEILIYSTFQQSVTTSHNSQHYMLYLFLKLEVISGTMTVYIDVITYKIVKKDFA